MTAAPRPAVDVEAGPWRDPAVPVADRVEDLIARMTLEEKIGQLVGVWVGANSDGADVAPHQHDLAKAPADWDAVLRAGLGQFTRPFGTAPVDPALGALALARSQAALVAANRFGIPALAHEECLAGFTAWGATIYPVPLAWGATFDPELVRRMARQIGTSMRGVGVHQGLAPVLDVARDPRWGRVEETIGADPYLVSAVGSAYVAGLESSGIIATLKHFVGYSVSSGGRNLAPVSLGRRELVDVLFPSFEAALRFGGARSVMQAYVSIDGVPVASDAALLTTLLREEWGFTGTVVADYFAIVFLQLQHGVAASEAEAAALALSAGIDVDLPTRHCYGDPLLGAVQDGAVPEELVDRALRRVLAQKIELGLLDPDWCPTPPALAAVDGHAVTEGSVSLDPPEGRELSRQIAEASVVLLATSPALPLAPTARIAVVGPNADEPMAMLGCYSFPSHVGVHHPEVPFGVEIPSLLAALRAELPGATIEHAAGCAVSDPGREGFASAVGIASDADVVVAVLGDFAALFGRGTSGEGCDAGDLSLPGEQGALLEELLATGKPVVLVMLSGRPYALGAYADRLAGVVQAFFPGQSGGPAVAGVLSGRVNPAGRLPVEFPRRPADVTFSYLAAPLGQVNEVSSIDPTPLFPFGHGLSYTSFEWSDALVDAPRIATDGTVTVSCTVRNTGDRAGVDVVQLYLHDPVAQVVRPVVRLVGFARVELEPGEARRVQLIVHADLTSFAGRVGHRVVEPGLVELRLARSAADGDVVARLPVELVGPERRVGFDRVLFAEALVTDAG